MTRAKLIKIQLRYNLGQKKVKLQSITSTHFLPKYSP